MPAAAFDAIVVGLGAFGAAATGADLLTVTGGLWISSPRRRVETHVSDFFARTLAAARF